MSMEDLIKKRNSLGYGSENPSRSATQKDLLDFRARIDKKISGRDDPLATVDVDYIDQYLNDHQQYWSGYGAGKDDAVNKNYRLDERRAAIDSWLSGSLADGTIDQEWYDEVARSLNDADQYVGMYQGQRDFNSYLTDWEKWYNDSVTALDSMDWSTGRGGSASLEAGAAGFGDRDAAAREWLETYKDQLGTEYYEAMLQNLDSVGSYSGKLRDAYDQNAAYYGQWETQGDYDRHLYLKDADTEAMSRELDAMKKAYEAMAVLEGPYGLLANDAMPEDERLQHTLRYNFIKRRYGETAEEILPKIEALEKDLAEASEYQGAIAEAQRLRGWEDKYSGMSYSDIKASLGQVEDEAERQYLESIAPSRMTDDDYASEIASVDEQITATQDHIDVLSARYTDLDTAIANLSASSDPEDWRKLATAQNELDMVLTQLDSAKKDYDALMTRAWELDHARQYETLEDRADFTANSTPMGTEGTGIYHKLINSDLDRTEVMLASMALSGNVAPLVTAMTQEERDRYNYLYNTEGKQTANEYLDYLKPTLHARPMGAAERMVGQISQDSFLGSLGLNALSVPFKLAGGLGYLDIASQNLWRDITGDYRPIDYNTPFMGPTRLSRAIRSGTAAGLTDQFGTIQLDPEEHPFLSTVLNGRGIADVYQLGMSAIDSRAAGLTGNPVAATALLSSSAATEGVLDALERGATDEEALEAGFWNGAFEAIFEFVEVDNLLKGDPSTVKAMVNQAITEGLGEGFTSVANNIADAIIMADKSALQLATAEYMQNENLSYKDAFRKAFIDMAVDIGWDAIGGGFSGSMSAGGYAAANAVAAKRRYNALPQQIKTSTERLQGLGMDRNTALDASGQLYKLGQKYEGQRDAFMAAYDPKQDVYQYASDFNTAWEIGRNNGNREYIGKLSLSEAQGKIAYELGVAAAKAKSEAATVSPEEKESGYSVSEGGETVSAETGRKITIKGFTSVGSDATLDIGGGKTIKAEDVSYADIDEAMLYETVAEVAGSTRNANNILEDYRKAAQSGMSASDYAAALRQTYDLGVSGQVAERQLGNYELAGKLGVGVRSIVFSQGHKHGDYKATAKQAVTQARGRQAKGNRKGTFHFERNGRTFSKTQEASLRALEGLSKALGVDIYIYESYEDGGKRVYQDRSGKAKSAPNGWYDTETGAIHIDLNAGNFGQGTMMFTAAHELTHFIKDWSEVKFRKLADLLVKRYAEQGVSVRDLIDNQIAKAEKNGRTIDRDTAFEEVVADSMETMLTQGDAASFMAELKQQDKTLWEKVQDWFKNLAEKLRSVVDAYKGYTPDSPEGRIVAQMEDFIGVLQEAYSEALMDASENYRANEGKKNTTLEGGVKYSLPDIASIMRTDEEVENNIRYVASMDSVYRVSADKLEFGNQRVQDIYKHYFDMWGNNIHSDIFGDIAAVNSSVRSEKRHGTTPPKIASIEAIPAVIQNGKIIGYINKHNGKLLRIVVAAPIDIGDTQYYMGVMLQRDTQNQRLYIHDVVINKEASELSQEHLDSTGPYEENEDLFLTSIIKKVLAVKPKSMEKRSDREYLAAVERGDMATAQRMVDEAAKRWGAFLNNAEANEVFKQSGEVRIFYHGTNTGDFTVFDKSLLGNSSGDLGWFGKGFYFAFSSQEAASYGGRVINAYLKMSKPYDYSQLYEFKGSENVSSRYSRFAWLYNIVDQFPDIVNGQKVYAYPNDAEDGSVVSWKQLAKWMDRIERDVEFSVEQVETPYGETAWELRADPKQESFTNADGETFTWTEYGMRQQFTTEEEAKAPINQIGAYLANVMGVETIPRRSIEKIDFSGAVQRAGYDGIIQSPSGDEAVVFEPSQIKSSDPVTYDDAGNVIPLSERFDTTKSDIRYSDRDSSGAELTQEQQEYFRDSVVRDAQGRLMVMYHGTPKGGFTVFDTEYGSYFTSDKRYAELYTRNGGEKAKVYGVYLNITKPFDTRNARDRKIFEREFFGKWGNGTPLSDAGLPDWTDGNDLVEFLREKGYDYDGVVISESNAGSYEEVSYVIMDPEQAKEISNKTPTSDPDIRFSDRDPTAAATAQELEKQNAKLRQDVKDLRELLSLQGKLTKGTEFRRSSIEAAVKGLAQTAGATLDADGRTQLYDMLKGFYRYIASDENLAWEGVREEAGKIADFLQSNVKFKPQRSDYANDVLGYLRGQRVALSESQRAEVEKLYGYENFRRQLFGAGIYLSKDGISLDSLWHEAAGGDMFPGTFDMDIAEGNQPAELLRVIDGMREDDSSGALEYAYNRDFIRQDLIQAVYDSYWRVDNLHTVADRKQREINEIRRKHNERMDALKESHQQTIKRLKEERRADIQAVREAYRERNARDLQKARERYAQARERGREIRAAASQRQIVEKAARDMMNMLSKPTKDAHVPMALQKPLEKLLNSIDFTSNRAAAGGEPTIRDVAYTRALQDVKLAIAAQRTALEGDGDGTFSLDVPKEFLDQIDAHIKMIQDATEGLDLTTNRVYEMSSDELRDLAYILKTINRAVRQIDKLHMEGAKARVSDLAKDTVWEMGRRKPVKTEDGGAAMWANYTPTFAFERMGRAATQILDGLKMGQAKLARTSDAIIKFAGETYNSKEVKDWEHDIREIKLESGKTVKMTSAQIMSFYCLSRREQAKGHLNGGGIRMGNIGEGRKEVIQRDHYKLTQNDIARINGMLTDRQREVANKLQGYMADVGGKLGNEISMARWDYVEMTDKDYFPIRSDSDIHDARNPDQDKANLWGLLNKSFTKAVVKGANDAMIVSSIFDVFANHMSEMAEYNAFALPLVDAMKWYNYRETQKGEGDQITTVGVKKALNDTLGTAAGKYFIDLMTDINSSQKAGRFENFFGKLLSRSKGASVGWNLRVAIQQPTAILRASVYLDPRSLARGVSKFGSKKLGEEMRKYSGIALWKSLGYYDLNISRGVTEQIKGDTTLLDKMNDWGMWLPGKMDQWTWTSIWAGCKAQVQAEKNLTGEALLRETAKLFDDLVYHTQVADSVLTRSSLMRSKSQTVKELTSFMAEPTMSANLLLSAFQDYREGVTKGEKAKRAMRIAFCGYVLSGLANALITAFADAFRDDDEYEGYWEKYFQALFGEKVYDGNLFAELNPLEKIVFVRDILSMLQGYEASKNPFMELVESSVGLLENIGKFIQGKGSLTAYGLIYQGLQVLGSFTGAAPANMLREVTTIWNNTFGKWNNMIIHRYETDPKQAIRDAYKAGALGKREAQDALIERGVTVTDAYWMVKEWETGNTSKYTDLYTAALNGQDLTTHIQELTENGKTKKEVLSELKSQIGTWYTDPESDTRIDREEAQRMLEQYFDLNTDEIEDQLRLWDMKADTGFGLNDLKQKFLDEAVSADDAVRYLVEYGGKTQEDAQERVDEWAFELEHGYSYDDIRQTYQDGEITADEARDVMMEVAGKTQEQADYSLLLWDFEKENGWKYEDRAPLYKDGKITRDQLSKALMDVGEYEKQDALYQVEVYDWEMEGLEGATIKRVQKWHEYCKSAGISKETFLDIHVFSANTKNDVDAEGKTINYSAMKKVMAEINRLPLSNAQKDALAQSLGWLEKNIRKYKPW